MKQVKFTSDYSPETFLRITRTGDGDIILKISGPGEMRIATSGGKLHGQDLVSVCSAFNKIMNVLGGGAPSEEPAAPVLGFTVIDTKTGEYPDLWEIALKEEWAKELEYSDMQGFAIEEDGTLLLLDECGKHAYCPAGRFIVRLGDGLNQSFEPFAHRPERAECEFRHENGNCLPVGGFCTAVADEHCPKLKNRAEGSKMAIEGIFAIADQMRDEFVEVCDEIPLTVKKYEEVRHGVYDRYLKPCSACDGGFGDNTEAFRKMHYRCCPYCGRRLEDI